ncbi:unnamed protein product [Ectocarpus sp. 8 AP-2014]
MQPRPARTYVWVTYNQCVARRPCANFVPRRVLSLIEIEWSLLDPVGSISLGNLKKVANEFGHTISDAELMEMISTANYVEGLADADEQLSNQVSFPDFYNLMTKGRSAASTAEASPKTPGGGATQSRSSSSVFGDVGVGA